MSKLEVLIVIAAFAAGGSGFWRADGSRSVLAVASVSAGLAAVSALAVDRWRWPLAIVAVGLMVAGIGSRVANRALRALVALVCLGLVGLGGAALWAFPRLSLPEPSGAAAVGTTTFEWTDAGRDEAATARPDDRRRIVVQAWYPGDPSARNARAHYLGPRAGDVAAGIASQYGLPAILLEEAAVARTNAWVDAAPAADDRPWPVVLFSPGLGGFRAQNTAWAEDLASHGFFVAAVDHPYDSAAVALLDGRVIRSTVRSTGRQQEDDRMVDRLTAVRAADLRFALTRIEALDVGHMPSPFTGRLDTERVAAVGHSVGGAAAIQAAQQDDRIDAVIDLDGMPRNVSSSPFPQPVLAVVAGRGTGDAENDADYQRTLARVFDAGVAGGYRLTVEGASHLTFTDAPSFLPPVPALVGSVGSSRAHEVTVRSTRAFLDAALGGRSTALVPELGRYGALEVFERR